MRILKSESLRLNGKRPLVYFAGRVVLVVGLLFYSCGDAIDDATKIDVPVSDVAVELDDILVEDGKKSLNRKSDDDEDGLNYFEANQTIYLDSIGSLADVMKYQSQITDVTVEEASICIVAADDENGTLIKDFVLKAVGVADLSIPQYNLGENFSEEMLPFATSFMLKLLLTKSVEIKVSGETDVSSGKALKVKITLGEMTLKVDLSK